jgi:hypothetical protein
MHIKNSATFHKKLILRSPKLSRDDSMWKYAAKSDWAESAARRLWISGSSNCAPGILLFDVKALYVGFHLQFAHRNRGEPAEESERGGGDVPAEACGSSHVR